MGRETIERVNPAVKRSAIQRQQDAYRISKWLFRGQYTHAQIAEMLNAERQPENHISVQTVTSDIKKLKTEWMEKKIDNIDYLVNRELARMDHLEQSIWEALEKNKRTVTSSKRSTTGSSDTDVVEELPPNPALFGMLQAVQKDRRKLLGLYAPSLNLVANVEVKGYRVISPDDWPDSKVVDGEYKQLDDGKD